MALPDTKIATEIMAELETAINVGNNKQKAHDNLVEAVNKAREELNTALASVDEARNKLLNHLGAGTHVRQA